MTLSNKKSQFLLLSLIFFLGCLIAFNRGSNFSDGDSYSLILAYLNFFNEGFYTPSRGAYGHPIPELFIGFLAYYYGTPISNIFCFILFFFSILFLYKTFFLNKSVLLFFILVFSNFYLFFENTNSIDYPIAMFFFSVGLFLLKKEWLFLSYIFFGLTIASRANFLTFIYPILLIYFFDQIKRFEFKNTIISFLIVTAIGLIFYIPLFQLHNFTFGFLDLPFLGDNIKENAGWYGGPPLSLDSLLPRFFYKVNLTVGIYSSFIIILFLSEILKKIEFFSKDIFIINSIIFINLFVFFFMPTKILIINPFIIFLYVICFKYLENKKILLIIFFNFLTWLITYQIADIQYKEKNICTAHEAIDYKFNFSINNGNLINFYSNKDELKKCYGQFMGKYKKNFEEGKPLILSR
ncbi:hypothetical protein OAM22_04580 [Candidatus Pelagibacter sp.]|nr:hypothetical protein [Candidatus Pelagibacter sp.]